MDEPLVEKMDTEEHSATAGRNQKIFQPQKPRKHAKKNRKQHSSSAFAICIQFFRNIADLIATFGDAVKPPCPLSQFIRYPEMRH